MICVCKKVVFSRVMLLSFVVFIPNFAWANKTIYYFTQPIAGHSGYGYSTASACANVNKTREDTQNGIRTFATKMVNANTCMLVMTDTKNSGQRNIKQIPGKIRTINRVCEGDLSYSIYSYDCLRTTQLKQQITEKETNNKATKMNIPNNDSEHLIG